MAAPPSSAVAERAGPDTFEICGEVVPLERVPPPWDAAAVLHPAKLPTSNTPPMANASSFFVVVIVTVVVVASSVAGTAAAIADDEDGDDA